MSLFPRGTARGLLNYQDKVDKQREKLQEKLERRMEKLMTLGITRDGAMAKLPSYSKSLRQIHLEIEGATGAEGLLKGLAAMPSAAPEILKYWKARSKNQDGIELTAQEKVNSITPLEISQIQGSGGETTANIMASIDTEQLGDLNYYGEVVRRLSNIPTGNRGTFLYKTAPNLTTNTQKINEQNKFLEEGMIQELTAFSRTGIKNSQGNFKTMDNGNIVLNPAGIAALKEIVKSDLASLVTLKDDNGDFLFGEQSIKKALNSNLAIFNKVLEINPTYRQRFLAQIPPASKQLLVQSIGTPNETRIKEQFDERFGRGASIYYLNSLGV
jgi:hypothetical protein